MSTQSKVTPNRLQEAKNFADAKAKGAIEMPETIDATEEHLYHVAVITSKPNFQTSEFEHSIVINKLTVEAYAAVKDQLERQKGAVVILHDPTDVKATAAANTNNIEVVSEAVNEKLEEKDNELEKLRKQLADSNAQNETLAKQLAATAAANEVPATNGSEPVATGTNAQDITPAPPVADPAPSTEKKPRGAKKD